MQVFVTGGSGQTGPAIVAELIRAGHTVTGLARSDAAAARLAALGATPHRGSVEDLDSLRRGAEAADGVVHLAQGGSFDDVAELIRLECEAIDALGQALVGTGKPFVSTSATLVLKAGELRTELDPADRDSVAGFRIPGERICLGFAGHDVRASVVRLAPTVHGPADHGFIPALIAGARRNGVSAYLGDGENEWPAVHREDAAVLFRLALEKAAAGSVLHGVAETVTIKRVAEKVGQALDIPVASLSLDEAIEHLGNPHLARFFALHAPVSSAHTQQSLGWRPRHPSLLADLTTGDYFDPAASERADATWR